jgi:hypothetical protein
VEDTRPAVQDIRQVVDRKIGQATTPLLERIETLECRLDELTGEVDTAAVEGYDSGEA